MLNWVIKQILKTALYLPQLQPSGTTSSLFSPPFCTSCKESQVGYELCLLGRSSREWGLFSELVAQSVCPTSQPETKAGILMAQGLAATLTPITWGHLLCPGTQPCAGALPRPFP